MPWRTTRCSARRGRGFRGAGSDHDRRLAVVVGDGAARQARGGARCERSIRLPVTDFTEDAAARRQPLSSRASESAEHIEPVGTSVVRCGRLVIARLRRHEGQGGARHVGHVGNHDIDAAPERIGESVRQIPGGGSADSREIPHGTRDGKGVCVCGVQSDAGNALDDGPAQGAGSAAHVDDDAARVAERRSLVDESRRTLPRNEHSRNDGNAQSTELGKAHDVLGRFTREATLNHALEIVLVAGRAEEERSLVFGEHAAGRTQAERQFTSILLVGILAPSALATNTLATNALATITLGRHEGITTESTIT